MYKSFEDFYKNKRVLVTGHSGFKGSWLVLWLNQLGAEVLGYSLEPNTEPATFNALKIETKCKSVIGNILNKEKLEKTFTDFQPEIVFHLAAQPLVRKSYLNPVETYETNVMGTLNVLETARKCNSVKAFVNITTDKCYENKETCCGYTEDEPMGGCDMYSSSKACVEIMSASYRKSFLEGKTSFALATARAGNVIGGGDWAQDRLIPDCIKSVINKGPIELRNPNSIRPWQHVLEPLSGYLTLGEKLFNNGEKYAQGFNFGPNQNDVMNVIDIAKRVTSYWGEGEITTQETNEFHEAKLLILNIEKSKNILGWEPSYNVEQAIEKTVEWYKRFYNGENMIDFSIRQIKEYEEAKLSDEKFIGAIT